MPVSPPVSVEPVEKLAGGVRFRPHGQEQVRTIERAHENFWAADEELPGDFGPCRLVRGRGHRDHLDARKRFRDLAQAQIFRAEIVAPLRDAMRLVDGEQIDLSPPQGGDRVVAHEPLGRDVKKPERSLVEAARDPPAFVGIGRGIEARRLDTGLAQLGDLVAHQRDQRRNHKREAAADDPRKLEEKRLAAARRHDREHVLARERGGEHVLLSGTKIREAEDGRERRARLGHERGIGRHHADPPSPRTDAGPKATRRWLRPAPGPPRRSRGVTPRRDRANR